jgi:methionyl-tRNA formyltransferase
VQPEVPSIIERLLAATGHRLVGILTAPGPRSRRTDGFREIAQVARPGLDVVISNYPTRWAAMIRPLNPDLLITISFNWKLPADLLAVPRLGAINFHDGALPRYRGLNATGWALRNGEREWGTTIHYMTPDFDDGPILSQRLIPIADDDDVESLRAARGALIADLFQEAVERIAAGDPGDPQNEADAYVTPGHFEDDWLYINWNKPARDVHNQVRSWVGTRDHPRGALAEIDGALTRVIKTQLIDGAGAQATSPGTVLERTSDSLLIQCSDRPLKVLRWQPEPAR